MFLRNLLWTIAVVWITSTPSLAQPVISLKWLDGESPATREGVSWGVPWAKGVLAKNAPVSLRGADGSSIPVQTWPLAYWPDGSIKWSGHAIASTPGIPGELRMTPGPAAAPATALTATDSPTAIDINTGTLKVRILKSGSNLFESLTIGERQVASGARLVMSLEDRSRLESEGITRHEPFVSRIDKVTLEQSGPIRAVVKIEGMHKATKSDRAMLPFVVRFYFSAGTESIRIVHSFIYDGDQYKDFVKSLGLTFTVPFKEELHNRHVRFVGEGTGAWNQPVRLMPGYRNTPGADEYAQHLAGKRMPNLEQQTPQARTAIESVAVYNDMKLTQLGPNSFSIDKRTTDKSSWLHVNDGKRSLGLAVLGDVSGGIAVGLKDFWQKYPSSLEINKATTDAGELTIWLWSPDAGAMDMRTYDHIPHGLPTSYEDWKPGWGTGYGAANTSEMTLWAFNAIPENADVVKMARSASAPPLLVSTPEYYHSIPVLGRWPLVDRSTPTLRWVEDTLAQFYEFYRDQVDERHWYGFYNFGDIMHNYDFGRHDWRYDIGGWAWANTELMPDMFLWYTFLRTGKADAFRMAEAMTRHTSEVDCHHIGPFAPMGSRHTVNHWGDGAKQPRASHAMLKRYLYYLSGGDERLGDLMREQLDADLAYSVLQKYNDAHYVPNPDGTPRLTGSVEAPSPEELTREHAAYREQVRNRPPSTTYTYSDGKPMETRYSDVGFTLEWISYSVNWMTEWERTGDVIWRDRVLAGMKNIVTRSQGRAQGNYFSIIFGGPEIMYEQKEMFDYPEFWEFFTQVMESVAASTGNNMTAPRGAAYAAWARQSQEWGNLAWDNLVGTTVIGDGLEVPPLTRITGPEVFTPVTDPTFLGRTAGWQLHGVASMQWALNALQTLEFAKPYLPAWEAARKQNGGTYVDPRAEGRGGNRGGGGGGGRRGGRGARGAATAPGGPE